MLLSLNWLREWIDFDLTTQALADKLTMSGTEVQKIIDVGRDLDQVWVGEILTIEPHPNADKLRLATVKFAADQVERVVCGAPNIEVGQHIAFAQSGARLFMNPETKERQVLAPAVIRGIESSGMICSERELGLGSDHKSGIVVLPADTIVGMPFAAAMGLADTIFEMEVTPNRGDELSVLGIAREVAAIGGIPLKQSYSDRLTAAKLWATSLPVSPSLQVEVREQALCPVYSLLQVDGITPMKSPLWMRWRLQNCGIRPIGLAVDITNYVMLELGQPEHAFDRRDLGTGEVVVRCADADEALKTLDGVERKLNTSMLVIADEARAIGVAGVMGGENSEIKADSTQVVFEAAQFDAINVRHTSTQLGIRSESSSRFEKFVDPNLHLLALKRSFELLHQAGSGGEIAGIIDQSAWQDSQNTVCLASAKVEQLLGETIKLDEASRILTLLGFGVAGKTESVAGWSLEIKVPSFRPDVRESADLVEEIGRVRGYRADNARLPLARFPLTTTVNTPNLTFKIKQTFANLGFTEVIGYSLLSRKHLERLQFDPAQFLALKNPLADFEFLPSTLLPRLLLTAERNAVGLSQLQLFEVGNVFGPLAHTTELPAQKLVVAGLVLDKSGQADSIWKQNEQAFKTALQSVRGVLQTLGHAVVNFAVVAAVPNLPTSWLHPARSVSLNAYNEVVGFTTELNPKQLKLVDLDGFRVVYFELDLSKLLAAGEQVAKFKPFSEFPAIAVDLSFIVPEQIAAKAIAQVIRDHATDLMVALEISDIFAAEAIGTGKKSMTWSLKFQSMERTLSEDEVQALVRRVAQALEQSFAASIRSAV